MSYNWGDRLGVLAIAAAVLYAAVQTHGARQKAAKWAGVVFAFLAGCAFLMTFIGSWIAAHSGILAAFAVAGLLVGAAIIGRDCMGDRTPDKKRSFWTAFLLPALLVVGLAQLPAVGNQIGAGGNKVMSTISNTNGYNPPAKKK